ncbi:hypothetical protein L6R53_03080 [Myxococcota bacterium]|nr:hypothetical protein [Myxococcota bacterium]
MLTLLTAMTTAALANGGPVAWTEGTGLGGLAPAETTPVRLVGERLRITPADDRRSYTAHAIYRLHNPGPATTVRYGVPLVAHAGEPLVIRRWRRATGQCAGGARERTAPG